MTTQLEIWNMALGRVGEGTTIDDIAEKTSLARACRRFYRTARNATLEMLDWQFARRREAAVTFVTAYKVPWPQAYAWPNEALAIRRVMRDDDDDWTRQDPVEFDVMTNLSQESVQRRFVVAREPVKYLVCTVETEVPLFPPLFADALAWRLAVDLATAVARSRELRNDARAAFTEAIALARGSSETQRLERRQRRESRLLAARR